MAKLPTFSRKTSKVSGFLIVCRLFIRIKMRNDLIEDLESGSLSYTIIGEFLSDLKKKFGREDNKTIKVAELKKVEQGGKIIEDFVQKFRRAARESEY